MNRKMLIGIGTGTAVVIIALITFFCIRISGKTKEAKTVASEFVTLLQAGELGKLNLEYYAYSQEDNEIYRDESGVIRGQTLTKQQMAEIYGTEAVMGTYDSEEIPEEAEAEIKEEELLKVIMKHTQLASNVGTVFGNTVNMNLQMLIPDLKTWLLNLSDEELQKMNEIESNQEFLEEIGHRIESGEITTQYTQLMIPMLKQNGKWRFQVTEEMEKVFFGGLYQIFDTQNEEAQ